MPAQGGTTQGAGQQGAGQLGGAMQDSGAVSAAAGTEDSMARDGVTQLNAENAASQRSSDRLPVPVAAALAAAMVATAAGVVLLSRRMGRSQARSLA
jgi:hypothetical protein